MARQRIVFVNLHACWMLVRTASVIVYKFSPAIKHGYLLKYLLDHPEDYEVCTYLNDRAFSLFTKGPNWLQTLLNLLSPLEHQWIMRKNGIKPASIKRIKKLSNLTSEDILITYNIHNDTHLRGLMECKAFKAHSMLHFHGTSTDAPLIQANGIDTLFCETDLSKSSEIFRRFYPLNLPWAIHPFVYAERFKNLKPFKDRQNKAFSVGTITYKRHREFLEVYGNPCDQPVRKFVKDYPEYFSDTIDCYSEDYDEGDSGKAIKAHENPISKLYKRVYNKFHNGRQKKYFSFDMVEKFNDYKMNIVGEEILGVPGIGYVEGMACGSAYIGLDSPMYRDLGLIPGLHYISYDGTKEDLRRVIEHYQKPENQAELERIAATGCDYVRTHFNGPTAAQLLLSKLKDLKQKNG